MPGLPLPDPPLRAGPVLLRPWGEADVPAIVAACQDPAITRWSPTIPSPYGERDALDWLEGQGPARREGRSLELAVAGVGSGEVLGAVALSSVSLPQLRSGVGCWLAPRARGARPCHHGSPPLGGLGVRPSRAWPARSPHAPGQRRLAEGRGAVRVREGGTPQSPHAYPQQRRAPGLARLRPAPR
jgi:hypothetical protein